MVIELNSGSWVYFYQKNHDFLLEIMEVMTNCINNNSDRIYTVSMDTYNIESCQFGNGNIMINTKECAVNVLREEQWNELENFLKLRVDETKTLKSIHTMTNEVLEYVKKKDESGLKGFIKRNKEVFFTNVLNDVASSGLTLALTKLSF